ncbi:MAG TPA: transcriptional regulator [Sphingomicrobium sp.]|nr:transcriptional regulator [Sphingomicrobium sp.]
MEIRSFRFDRFSLDPAERQLKRDGAPVELNGRYFDALALMLREQGRLVSKDRFLEEVWRGVPVTDEALTQCIKTLRRQLGDDAAAPRFIETVPKYGYRFIATVEQSPQVPEGVISTGRSRVDWRRALAGTLGGGLAGAIGGLLYGSLASQPLQPGMGALSVLLVLLIVTATLALIGAAGVAVGIAAAGRPGPGSVVGGALGGLVVGAIVKLLGLDAFILLFGQMPGDITGAPEGAILGSAVGLGAWLGSRGNPSPRRSAGIAALCGAAGGIGITMLGGRLMGGSLDLLSRHIPTSRLRLDEVSGLFGEGHFGPVSLYATSALEAALFTGCVVGAMAWGSRYSQLRR